LRTLRNCPGVNDAQVRHNKIYDLPDGAARPPVEIIYDPTEILWDQTVTGKSLCLYEIRQIIDSMGHASKGFAFYDLPEEELVIIL
jgi:hypothetical protein